MTRLLLAIALSALLCSPAAAGQLQISQGALNAVQLTDAYSISRMTWRGDAAWDQTAPMCARTAVREFGCQAVAITAIRLLEKPSKGTVIANYIAAVAYGWYIHKAVQATVFSVRF
jgi:hypothetical protein